MLSLKKLFLATIGRLIPSDYFANRFPVSVKGLLFIDERVVLVKNERGEWDLPGGKLAKHETIQTCLVREMKEELGIAIEVEQLLDVFKINIVNQIKVIILVYECRSNAVFSDLKLSGENFDLGLFSYEDLSTIVLPNDFRKLIRNSFDQNVR